VTTRSQLHVTFANSLSGNKDVAAHASFQFGGRLSSRAGWKHLSRRAGSGHKRADARRCRPLIYSAAMRDALFGLLGACIGAGATAGVALWGRRDSRRQHARTVARLLLGEAAALRADLSRCRSEHRVLPGAGDRARLLLEGWRERPEELSELPAETWHYLTMWVHAAHMAASDVDRVSTEGWSQATDHVYEELESLLGQAEDLLGLAAGQRPEANRDRRALPRI